MRKFKKQANKTRFGMNIMDQMFKIFREERPSISKTCDNE